MAVLFTLHTNHTLHASYGRSVYITYQSQQHSLHYIPVVLIHHISIVAVVFTLHAKNIAPVFRLHTFHGSSVHSVYSRHLCLRCIPVMAVEFTLHIIHGIRVSDDTAATCTLHTSHGSIVLLCMSVMARVFTPNTNHYSSSYSACVIRCSSSNSNSSSSSSSC